MNKLNDEQLIAAICQHLDRSIADLDHSLHARLNVARESAIASAGALSAATTTKTAELQDDVLVDSVVNTMNAAAEVSPDIEQKLDQIRHQAIARLEENNSAQSLFSEFTDRLARIIQPLSDSLIPKAPMIATACLTLTVASVFYMSTLSDGNISVEDEILLVASADELELYENLDFYLWLEEIEQTN